MIYYFIIFMAVVCFAGQFAFTKLFQSSAKQNIQTALVMLMIANAVGSLIFFCIGGFKVEFTLISFLFALAFAIVTVPYYTIGIKVLSLGSLAIYSMFMMLGGMLVPFFYGILFLDEDVSAPKVIGSILMTLCIVLQALWQKSEPAESSDGDEKSKKGKKSLFFILCICIFFINGTVCIISKSHAMSTGTVPETSFTFLSCALTVVLSGLFLALTLIKNTKKVKSLCSAVKTKPIAFSALIGCAAYVGNFLLLVAANKVPASVQFPLISGGTIALSAIVSFAFFREKLSVKEWISVAGAFACTFLFVF